MDRDSGIKKADLVELARKAGIKGRSRMTKKQLIEALAALSGVSGEAGGRTPASQPPWASPEFPPPPIPWAPPDLPPLLGENRIALLPQGPRRAFAYWETSGEVPEDLILKVVAAPEGTEIRQHHVRGPAGSFYIHPDQAGITIEAVLGTMRDGRFHPILRSNRIRLPDDSISPDMPGFWMTRKGGRTEITPIPPELGGDGVSREGPMDGPRGFPNSSRYFGRGKVFP